MRLIYADALTNDILRRWNTNDDTDFANKEVWKALEEAQTIDAEPVVRCKDCKWWTKQEKSIQGRCALNGTYPTGGWYCANGRKDDEID